MGGTLTHPPPEGQFVYVLRRHDKDPSLAWHEHTYEESLVSRDIAIDGVRAPTLFVRSVNSYKRLCKLGWLDETVRWRDRAWWTDGWLEELIFPSVSVDDLAVLTALLQAYRFGRRSVLGVRQVADGAGLEMDRTRAALKRLIKRGLTANVGGSASSARFAATAIALDAIGEGDENKKRASA